MWRKSSCCVSTYCVSHSYSKGCHVLLKSDIVELYNWPCMKISIRVLELIGDFLTCWLCCPVQLADCQFICFCSILLSNWSIIFLRKPLDCAMLFCCAVLAVLCCTVLCSAVQLRCVVLCCTVLLCCVVLCCAVVLYCTVLLCCAVLCCCAVLYCAVLCCAVLCSAVRFMLLLFLWLAEFIFSLYQKFAYW